MGRPTTKAELLQAATEKYEELNKLISSMTERELDTAFDFTKMKSKTQAHWGRDKNLRDILVHLYEWHRLVLDWVAANRKGENSPLLPEPYNWRTYGNMNMEIWKKHQNTSLDEAKTMLEQSHRKCWRWRSLSRSGNCLKRACTRGLAAVCWVLTLHPICPAIMTGPSRS